MHTNELNPTASLDYGASQKLEPMHTTLTADLEQTECCGPGAVSQFMDSSRRGQRLPEIIDPCREGPRECHPCRDRRGHRTVTLAGMWGGHRSVTPAGMGGAMGVGDCPRNTPRWSPPLSLRANQQGQDQSPAMASSDWRSK